MRKEFIIDMKNGDVTGDKTDDIIILKGIIEDEDSNYAKSLTLIIQDGSNSKQYSTELESEGYDFSLYLGDFNQDGKSEIMVYGQQGGSGGYAIGKIYEFIEEHFRIIFNAENFSEQYQYKSKYEDYHLIRVVSDNVGREYTLYIGDSYKGYLDAIYDKHKKVKSSQTPTVSYINTVYPVNNLSNNTLELLVQQRIIGVANADILGSIQSSISLKNNIVNIESQYALCLGAEKVEKEVIPNNKEIIKNIIGRDARIISSFSEEGLIRVDIDGNGEEEILCPYELNSKIYLAALREKDGGLLLLDTIEGNGYDISNLLISSLRQKAIKNVLVGFKTSSMWSNLEIYEFKKDKFRKVNKEDKIEFSRLEIGEFDKEKGGVNEIVLWSHTTGEAYDISILSFRGESLQRTYKYDKLYFDKVEEYYKELISRTRETPAYLYYLADAQFRAGNKIDANITIEKALRSSKPYPSLEEVKRLKKKISG